ncbi:hypothetical protein QWY85_11215 [Neolewinella lacunae]|uniref:Uncharacterized protein n=1 Tax=Neolewinella lacunae TaxID=1517758 RepID=A0A923PEG3_9BACT|nr:hypothetical protein [Neolewinella lacunae]MBC6992552.1 hypothetical protein [Neolewinella lacunae]MDN3635230.1 hypothetical protein [Neolewinella lacunae]
MKSKISKFLYAFILLSVLTQIGYNALSFSAVYFGIVEGYNSLYVSLFFGTICLAIAIIAGLSLSKYVPRHIILLILFLGFLSWLDPSLFSLILSIVLLKVNEEYRDDSKSEISRNLKHRDDILDQIP